MAKKGKGSGPNLSVVPQIQQKELYQRVNYTLQASAFLQSLGSSSAGSSDVKGKRKAVDGSGDGVDVGKLAKGAMKSTKKMAAHTQLKLDPSLKRGLCSSCGTVLIPGLTSRVRNRPNRRTVNVTHTCCLQCSTTFTLPAPPTTIIDPSLDGPRRKKRREKVIGRSKTVFHDRERGTGDQGHVLFQNDRKVEGWGVLPPEEPASGEGSSATSITLVDDTTAPQDQV